MGHMNADRRSKRERVDSAHKFLRRYADEKDNFLDSIDTGDEICPTSPWNETTITSVAAFLFA